MSGEAAVFTRGLEHLREELHRGLEGMRAKLEEMSKELRDVIRLDGDLKRHDDAIKRIGRQVDDHEERIKHIEVVRLPSIETKGAVTGQVAASSDRFMIILVSAAASLLSAVASGTVVYLVTH